MKNATFIVAHFMKNARYSEKCNISQKHLTLCSNPKIQPFRRKEIKIQHFVRSEMLNKKEVSFFEPFLQTYFKTKWSERSERML